MEYKTSTLYVYRDLGCDGVPNSEATNDACGVCGGTGATCADCAGTPHGSAVEDNCAASINRVCNT